MERMVPRQYKLKHEKALRGRSLRAAVDMFCLECVGYIRREVRECTNKECYFYKIRPYK